MGLCKCPKKKVTNQFCFEHRVNVCEHCIVADHTKCIVQSYLQWLNDSEYNPKCALCKNPLEEQPCTRLVCYDVFHSSCLASWGASHPSHTAPAGFKCPVCGAAVFPAPQLASPVALALKQTLATWDWARKAMGLSAESSNDNWSSLNGAVTGLQNGSGIAVATTAGSTAPPTSIPTHSFTSSGTTGAKVSLSTSSKAASTSASVDSSASVGIASSTHRKASSSDSHSLNVMEESDTDDNKYKRRPVLTWFKRWWRSYQPLGSGGGRAGGRRRCLALLVILLFTTLLLLFARTRSSLPSESRLDPAFDPLNNPNIHVQEAE